MVTSLLDTEQTDSHGADRESREECRAAGGEEALDPLTEGSGLGLGLGLLSIG